MSRLDQRVRARLRPLWYERVLRPRALTGLVWRTGNFAGVTWLGHPIWQNPLDAWSVQEMIYEDEVDLVVECGTNRGGSALYMANLFDLLGRGHVITIDVERLTDIEHPRIEYIVASSTEQSTLDRVKARIDELQAKRPMVFLDSDHAGAHVLRELQMYAELVPVGGHVCVQDGCIDELRIMRHDRPGPLWATKEFVRSDPRFVVDEARSKKFLLSHSPSGWLKRVR